MILHHKNPWFRVVEHDNYYQVLNLHQQVVVLPVVDESELILVQVRRPLFSGSLWELPAGAVEENESPLEGAMRELREETGIHPDQVHTWTTLDSLAVMPNRMTERAHVIRADMNLSAWEQRTESDEEIEQVAKLSIEKAHKLILSGEIMVALPIAVILRAFELREP